MAKIDTILVPTDFSEGSDHALEYAAMLAKVGDVRVVLLHVYALPALVVPEGSLAIPIDEVSYRDSLAAGLDASAEQLRALGVTKVETVVATGTPWREILRVAADHHVSLIVIGTHGRGGVSRLIFGSVAERVVRTATCPVLTVGPKAPPAAA